MNKNDKALISLAALLAIGVTTVIVFNWLETSPNCNRGCRSQLDHLKDHLLVDFLRAAVPQLGVLFS